MCLARRLKPCKHAVLSVKQICNIACELQNHHIDMPYSIFSGLATSMQRQKLTAFQRFKRKLWFIGGQKYMR